MAPSSKLRSRAGPLQQNTLAAERAEQAVTEEGARVTVEKKMNEWLPNELSVNPGKLPLLNLDGIVMRLCVPTVLRVP